MASIQALTFILTLIFQSLPFLAVGLALSIVGVVLGIMAIVVSVSRGTPRNAAKALLWTLVTAILGSFPALLVWAAANFARPD